MTHESELGFLETASPRRPRAAAASRRRVLSPWDALGFGAVASVASLGTVCALLASTTGYRWLTPTFVALTAVLAGGTAGGLLFYAIRDTVRPGALPDHLARVWREPPSDWVYFLLGWMLALPVFALHTTVIIGDSDSVRILASVLYVQQNGLDYLIQTQETLLPHLLLGPLVALGGIAALQLFSVLSVQALAGVVAFLTWRLTRSTLGVVAAVISLTTMTLLLERAYLVPMYPTMLALGFLGGYLAFRAINAPTSQESWRSAILSALCLFLSIESHQVGQLFLVFTALLALTAMPLAAAKGLGRVYLAFAVFFIPRAVINLLEGGFSHFLSNRVDFWTEQGYIYPIQVRFWKMVVDLSLPQYASKVPSGLLDNVWGQTGWLTLVLGTAALAFASRRLRWFALACALFMAAVAFEQRLPFFARYFSLFLVATSLGTGITLAGFLQRPGRLPKTIALLCLIGLTTLSVVSYAEAMKEARTRTAYVLSPAFEKLVAAIPTGEGVIGTRASYLDFGATDVRAYGEQFLTEAEYVTFLTWPSDQAVINIMKAHDISWVYVPLPDRRWVYRYNKIWIRPNYHVPVAYPRRVVESNRFCLAQKTQVAILYRLLPAGQVLPRPHPTEPLQCSSVAATP